MTSTPALQNRESMDQSRNWGNRPWTLNFVARKHDLPAQIEFAIVGGGFSGLSAAANLKRLAPNKSVALFEQEVFGAGSSGHTGGMVLAESAVGNLPGLGDVLAGYREIFADLRVEADLLLPGVHEIAHKPVSSNATIRWSDPDELSIVNLVEGGSIHPGKVIDGLGRVAEHLGVLLFENCPIGAVDFSENAVQLRTTSGGHTIRAGKVLFATNAFSLELTKLQHRAESKFTLAVATEELTDSVITEIGLADRRPFYTVDLPYLWGRLLGNQLILGSGLVELKHWRDLSTLNIHEGQTAVMFAKLQNRIRRLHPALKNVQFTHAWGGPICIADRWTPVFEYHPSSRHAMVLAAFSGHGVAQSVYLGRSAAQALLEQRPLPDWSSYEP